jgi:phospholipase A1
MNFLSVRQWIIHFLIAVGFSLNASAEALTPYQKCLLAEVERSDDISVRVIKLRCQEKNIEASDKLSAYEKRVYYENTTGFKPFTILPHKPNYLLPITYNFSAPARYAGQEDYALDKTEISFQLSLKFPLMNNVLGTDLDVMAAYTGRSFWQAYNDELSSPFRDTNHEPEIFVHQSVNKNIGPFFLRGIQYGLVHQSNGRSFPLSRSWNRAYTNFLFSYRNFGLSFKPWYRFEEDDPSTSLMVTGDDNPDIDDYLGKFELLGAYKYGKHSFSTMIRNNMSGDNKGALQLNWSFPMGRRIKGYVYYFNGYGETLLDYNHASHRLGFGFLLTDWL